MKIRNPFYKDPATVEAEAQKAAIDAFLAANPDRLWVSLADIRNALNTNGVRVSREVLSEYARIAAIPVDPQ